MLRLELRKMILIIEPLLNMFVNSEGKNNRDLINDIKEQLNNSDLPLERRIYLRKYTGSDSLKGILDYLPDNSKLIEISNVKKIDFHINSNFVIGPLNIEELDSYYNFMFEKEKSVYPIVHPVLASKFFKNLAFYPWIPKHIYIPENSLRLIKNFDFDSHFKNLGVNVVILKDEYGFHTGQMVPYILVKVGRINERIRDYSSYASKIENFGGIIIEEFIGNEISTVYKNHIFGKIIPHESIKYTVHLRGLEGIFKSYNPKNADLLEKVESNIHDTDKDFVDKLDPIIQKYFPYLFASFDYVLDQKGNPVVIDVNSIAGSLGEIQEMIGSNDHNPFEFFYEQCQNYPQDQFKKQREYMNFLNEQYVILKTLEGIFSFINGKIRKINN